MHRILLGASEDAMVDHVNQIRSDNRKSNLRFATKSQNSINSDLPSNNSSGFKGVRKWGRGFAAFIGDKRIGTFRNITDAAIARINAEIELFGEFSPFYNQHSNKLLKT